MSENMGVLEKYEKQGKYDYTHEDIQATVRWAMGKIKPGSTVLEFGPYNGGLTRILKQQMGCIVDIVELDEKAGNVASQYARDAVVGEAGDIENYSWVQAYADRQYDYIIFLDVIEHLIHTAKVLEQTKRFLKKDGCILLSIPNVAYNGILINLLKNTFQYTEIGLLDSTHVRFFTINSILELAKAFSFEVEIESIQVPIELSETQANYDNLPCEMVRYLKKRPYASVYQYLVSLKPSEEYREIVHSVKNIENIAYSCMFVRTDEEEYCEEKKVVSPFVIEDRIDLTFDVSSWVDTTEIRFDPAEHPCQIQNISCVAEYAKEKIELELLGMNGYKYTERYMFDHSDPQMIYRLPYSGVKRVRISFDLLAYGKEEVETIQKFAKPYMEEITATKEGVEEMKTHQQLILEKLEDMQAAYSEQNRLFGEKEEKLFMLERKLEKEQKEKEVCFDTLKQIGEELETAKQERTACLERKSQLEKELEAAQKEKEVCFDTLKQIAEELKTVKQERTACLEKKSQLEKELEVAQKEKEICFETIGQIGRVFEAAQKEKEAYLDLTQRLGKELEIAQEEKASYREKIENLGKELGVAQEEKASYREKIENLGKELEAAQKANVDSQGRIEQLGQTLEYTRNETIRRKSERV